MAGSDPALRDTIVERIGLLGETYVVADGDTPRSKNDAGGIIVEAKNLSELQHKLGIIDSSTRFRRAAGSLMYNPSNACIVRCHIGAKRCYKLLPH